MITITFNKTKLVLNHHITQLLGDNGTLQSGGVGKSLYVQDMKYAHAQGLLQLNGVTNIVFTITADTPVYSDTLYVIDEVTSRSVNWDHFFNTIQDVNGYVLYVGRLVIKSLTTDLRSLLHISYDGTTLNVKPLYMLLGKNMSTIQTDTIVCEDGQSAANWLTKALGLEVIPASGKDRVKRMLFKSNTIMVDSAKFGNIFFDLLRKASARGIDTVKFIAFTCLEEIFLLDNPSTCNTVLNDLCHIDFYDAVDRERFCEDLCTKVYQNYSKRQTTPFIDQYPVNERNQILQAIKHNLNNDVITETMFCINVKTSLRYDDIFEDYNQ